MSDKKSQFQKTSLWARFLFHFSGLLRCRIINGNHGEPYLERYHLFRLPGGYSVYLHRFLASDPDRGLHDHPWNKAMGFILSGSYSELRLNKKSNKAKDEANVIERHFHPGNTNHIRGNDFHRIILEQNKQVWTLFSHGPKIKNWGFLEFDEEGNQQFNPHESVANESNHENWWQHSPRANTLQRTEPI